MPHRKSIKHILIDIGLFIVVVAITGHITISFWEKYYVKNEIVNMKTSLHTLKNTVNKIVTAYDSLLKDLQHLAKDETKNNVSPKSNIMYKQTLDRRKQHDINVLAALRGKELNAIKTADRYLDKDNWMRNATTITRYPLKSTGVSIETRHHCFSERNHTLR